MENTINIPMVAKRIWNVVRVVFFMIRKGILKRKLMVDLNMMLKRGKIAGKALHNLMFHHHHLNSNIPFSFSTSHRRSHDGYLYSSHSSQQEYEFSCSNSPTAFPFTLIKRKHNHNSHNFFPCAHAPPTDDDVLTVNAVTKVLEIMERSEVGTPVTAMSSLWQSPLARDLIYSELSSPALPGFGRTPLVRQLRVTDSPFPLWEDGMDRRVDEAAEEFIVKFYNELKKQNRMGLQR